jgi:pimeloyl-ACP methyl ester carboxylesterase
VEFPGRVASLTLLDPGGFGRVGARFMAWVFAGGLAGLTPRPVRHRLAGPVRNATLRDDELMPLLPLIMRFRRRLPMPEPFTDDELRAIAVPTLVLLGEHSALYPAAQVAAHLARVTPAARVEIVPGASHDLPVHSPDLVADHIERFLPA